MDVGQRRILGQMQGRGPLPADAGPDDPLRDVVRDIVASLFEGGAAPGRRRISLPRPVSPLVTRGPRIG